jgi:hypothetical protein
MSTRILALLLWICPPAFRREYGASILELFETRRGRSRTRGARLRLWTATAVDICRTGAAEWLDSSGPVPGPEADGRPLAMTDRIALDLKDAVRRLAATPGFTVAALLMLAIGIGGSSVIFSAVDAFALRARPFVRPHELVSPP